MAYNGLALDTVLAKAAKHCEGRMGIYDSLPVSEGLKGMHFEKRTDWGCFERAPLLSTADFNYLAESISKNENSALPKIQRLVKAYYSDPRFLCGGPCHIVLDDDNVDDIEICIGMFAPDVVLAFYQENESEKTARQYQKNELKKENVPKYVILSGSAQFTDYLHSQPIINIYEAIGSVYGCDRIIMNQDVYDAINNHPVTQSAFREIENAGVTVKDDAISTIIYTEISIQDIENNIIIEKDGKPVYVLFQVIS